MDFTKFVSLLMKSSLFLARADKLGDPFEGSFSKANVELRPELYKNKIPMEELQRLIGYYKQLPRFTLINCWHWSEYESAAMWKLYSTWNNGIAVTTDFKSLTEGLIDEENIFVGKVDYVDYDSTFIGEGFSFAPYFNKRNSFEHEREVRAITQKPPISDQGIDITTDIYDVGTYYKVDLSILVKEVIVAPYAEDWLMELVQSVAERYGLHAPVTRSSLADEPTWW